MITIGDSDWDSDESDNELVITKVTPTVNGHDAEITRAEIKDHFDIEDLQTATTHGNLEVVKQLIESGFSVNTELRSGWTLLMYAVESGWTEIVQYYLDLGADVNYHYQMFYPIMACFNNPHLNHNTVLECVRLLLDAGALVNVHDKHHTTPLIMCAAAGFTAPTELLCQNNVDINKQDQKGWTALMHAVNTAQRDTVDMLLKYKASPFVHTFDGLTCADIAHHCGHQQLYEYLEKMLNPEQTSFKCPAPASADQTEVQKFRKMGDIDVFLTSIDLGNLISLFQEQKIEFATLLNMNCKDLERMGISQVGTQQKILEATKSIHASEWEMPDQSNTLFNLQLNCRDMAKVMKVYTKHIKYLNATANYLLTQLTDSHKLQTEYNSNAVEDSGILENFQNVYEIGSCLHEKIEKIETILSEKLNFKVIDKKSTSGSAMYSGGYFVVGVAAGALLSLAAMKLVASAN